MKGRFYRIIAVVAALAIGVGLAGCKAKTDETPAASDVSLIQQQIEAYAAAIDTEYAYNLAVEICESDEYRDNRLGDKQAGSEAEHKVAERIVAEMESIGLSNVEKNAIPVDSVQAGDSGLWLDGSDEEIVLHAYQTVGTPAGGLETEIVDVGDGTIWDYEDLDVEGKIVLLDIDQRANWWIGTPVLQALNMGAAAVLANNVSGFSEVATDAYNANDFCGPADLPTASITQDDAEKVRAAMEDGVVKAKLVIDNEYSDEGESYNVIGTIPGKDHSESILIGAHYDAYFQGFQDDTIAWTGVLAMAKAMVDSGYTPERDIIFICHGAEEWGESDTSYDWALGSYRQITQAKARWQGSLVAFINFELPAYEFSDYTYTESAPESYAALAAYNDSALAAQPEGVYADGVHTDGYQTYTYTDCFSYYVAGVPSFINGMLVDVESEEGDVFDFYYEYYHTNYDTKDTYNEAVFDWQLKYYGGLAIKIAGTPAVELDYTAQAERLRDSMDEELLAEAGVDVDALNTAIYEYETLAEDLNAKIEALNAADGGTGEYPEETWTEARALNAKNLALFKKTQDALLGLAAETPIVPIQWYQDNIALIDETVAYLEEGDVVSACDETGWAINAAEEWYSMNFDEETVEHGTDTYLGKYASQNWGTGKTYEYADVSEATRSITDRYEEEDGNFSEEIAIYLTARAAQLKLLGEQAAKELTDVQALTSELAGFAI